MDVFETVSFPMLSNEYEEGTRQLEILVHFYSDDNSTLSAEAYKFRWNSEEFKPIGKCALSDMCRELVAEEYTDRILDVVRDSNPAFERMSPEPYMTLAEYQEMVL